MLKNYFKTAIRNMLRNRVFSFITVIGLASGLTCVLLILTFVTDELSYDKFHSRKDNIYRITYNIQNFSIARVPPIFKEHLNDYFPEVEKSARFWSRSVSIKIPGATERKFEESNVNFADPELMEIFDFELVNGSLQDALVQPFTVILNEEMAEKYFEKDNPIGKTIIMEGNKSFKVTAVVKDFPANSHTHFDMLLPYDNMYDLEPETLREGIRNNFKLNWMVSHSPTYVLLKEGSNPENVNERFKSFVTDKIPENMQKEQSFVIQPLSDIHLNDDVAAQAEPPGSFTFLYTFGAVGVLTLLIACINFINLSTAKSLERAKEIGMRKVLGAWKGSLVGQFLGESLITSVIAAIFSIGFTILFLPLLNGVTNKALSASVLLDPMVLLIFIGILLLTSLLAGLYPSFFIANFSPLKSLKGITSGTANLSFRKGLIIVQFIISIMLISSTLIVFDQLNFLRNKPLGFQKNLMVVSSIQSANFNSVFGGVDDNRRQKLNAFEDQLESEIGIVASTLSSVVPGFGVVNRNVIPEGFTAQDNMFAPVMSVDFDFIETYGIEVLAGRGFSEEFATDPTEAMVVNEEALSAYNFGTPNEALGKSINLEGKQTKIIGVVKNFNFMSLENGMQPLLMEISVGQFSTLSVKISNNNIPETLAKIEQVWNEFFPDETFSPTFLDENLAQAYEAQENFGKLIGYFAFLAILISCLGSYGLIMFVANQRRKEVGIRKVLGASIKHVVMLLSWRFLILVVVSLVLAVPIIIYAANSWLEAFYYRIDLSVFHFLIAGLVTFLIVFITVSLQSYKAAVANPVASLRSE